MEKFFDVRLRGFRDRTDLDEAFRRIDERALPLAPEIVTIRDALGRTLWERLDSPIDLPGFPRAAMDGFAVKAEDTFGAESFQPAVLQVIGESFPGRTPQFSVTSGSAVRIMTGAPLPPGAAAVIPFESADESAGLVSIREPLPPGKNVARLGEDFCRGAEILPRGRSLRPQDIGVLSALGMTKVQVFRRPRVEILVTGNEILPEGESPSDYRIADSNSPMLRGLIERDCGELITVRYLRDDESAIRNAMSDSAADVLLVSGGSSVGVEDHAPRLLAQLGELVFHGLALRPAAPAGCGTIGKRLVFLIPGNPVSCLCAYDLLAGRAVRRLGGRRPGPPYPLLRLPLREKISSAIGRVDYVRVRIVDKEVLPLAVSGASLLSTVVRSDGFVLVEADREGFAPGEMVPVYLYDGVQSVAFHE